MAKGGDNERPAADVKDGVKKRRRGRRVLGPNGRYVKIKTQSKSDASDPAPAGDKLVTGVIFRRKRGSRSAHHEAKLQHAATEQELREMRLRERVLNLRTQGATIKQISDQLKINGEENCSPATVHRLLVAALKDLVENYTLKLRHNVQLQIQKLEAVELAHFNRLCDPTLSPDGVEKLSRAMERIWARYDGLLGLLKPQKVELSTKESLAKLLGRRPEELPDGNADA